MDFFKQIQAPTLHEAEVIVPIDNRGGGNKGLPRSEELKRKLSDFYKPQTTKWMNTMLQRKGWRDAGDMEQVSLERFLSERKKTSSRL